jgi:protein-S-isoprenylcysteine O-methyltransferase Ste14
MVMEEGLLFRLLFICLYSVFAGIRIYFRTRNIGRESKDEESSLNRAGIFLSIAILFFFAFTFLYLLVPDWILFAHFDYPVEVRWIGVVSGIATIVLLYWTHTTLGKQYSAKLEIQQEHELIQTGVYATVRHPMYTVFISFSLAVAIVSSNWLMIISAMLIGVGLYWITLTEEQMLTREFGEEYSAYQSRTGRFLPRFRGNIEESV